MTSELKHTNLLNYILCPVCRGDLEVSENQLKCKGCYKKFEIREGIPILLPYQNAPVYLGEEESLAKMMRRPVFSRKDKFNFLQWENSKKEFWGAVRPNIGPSPKSFINIGCGYDLNFKSFETAGNIFINFDIVYDMLHTLQMDFGAQTCVLGDINNLPFRRFSFDYVICIDVIHHHSENLKKLIESICSLLKPNGTLFLEDPNSWGLLQFFKSEFLPKPLYRILRTFYHTIKQSSHKPADYEFPTSVWKVRRIIKELGFYNINIFSNTAYPCSGELSYQLYKIISQSEWVRKYHNYHYSLSASRAKQQSSHFTLSKSK